ncbi:MAG: type II toxin-antitoxin system Phd/YefM family antitoxin [Anaerolineae bacterium]|nr:type II toxin-antitoxin system Phd/YefM family antitoxin [Anaerolineae bacterium]
MQTWQLQEAKNKLSELIDRVLSEGPQMITRHGREVVVVMPIAGYKKLTAPKARLGDFFASSPLRNSELVLDRDRQAKIRDLDL